MLKHTENLNEQEREIVVNSPLYVSALIAGADGDFSSDELKRTYELVHIKTFSEKFGLKDLYASLEPEMEDKMREMIANLPQEQAERNAFLTGKLQQLNTILAKMEYSFAHSLWRSLREFAHYIANADGGFWSMGSVSSEEQVFVKLEMLAEPQKD